MEDAPGALTPFTWATSPQQLSSPDDAMEDGALFEEECDIGKERQKFRRYRKRMPSTSILAKDLQIPSKKDRMEQQSPAQALRDHSSEREVSQSPEAKAASAEKLRQRFRAVKEEPEELSDSGELSFERFAFAVDAWLHGFTSLPELLQEFEAICRELSEAVRDEASDRHRAIEDRLLRQKAHMLHSEASSWSLAWHLFGKANEDADFDSPQGTSADAARAFVRTNETAQICLRVVQWLEGLASKDLDLEKKRKGWYAGSYMQKLGLWDQTKRSIKKNAGTHYVRHLDPDAPTREGARIHPEDQKLEDGLLEDVWKLLHAGRIVEVQNLCRTAGQLWRAASFGGCLMGYSPSSESWESAAKDRALEAIELDGGLGRQRRLWKWASYCASEKIATSDGGRYESAIFAIQCGNVNRMLPVCSDWESACWALARSWLDVQIELDQLQEAGRDTISGAENWPNPVLDQQPRDFPNLFQKLYSGNLVNDNVRRSCKEQHRLVQMDLVLCEVNHLLELLKAWILPARDDKDKPHGHPQIIRFAAHLVLVLRFILPEDARTQYSERLHLVGDLILNTYAIFLFAQRKEELVGAYASHLAPHLCIDLYVRMMELRQNDSEIVKRKLLCSAMEYLPFFPESEDKGSISVICDRFLQNSREIKPGVSNVKVEQPGDYQRLTSVVKAKSVQWLCFTPAGLSDNEQLKTEMLARALRHGNILFRELALVALWRTASVPEGAHILLGYLAEPLKENADALYTLEHHEAKANYEEFLEWQEYFACDAYYRNWLASESLASEEERIKYVTASQQALSAALQLIHRNEGQWLSGTGFLAQDEEMEWVELSVTAALSKPGTPKLVPDPTLCTTLTSALYLCMGEAATTDRELTVNVTTNAKNDDFLDIGLRCQAVEGERDGGFLASIMATAIKGELPHFQSGVVLEVLRMDAWYVGPDEVRHGAPFIVRGLCRRCCLPELVLRCMEIRAWLQGIEVEVEDSEDDLIDLVASRNGLHSLFSSKQLEELLSLEREIVILRTEEENAAPPN